MTVTQQGGPEGAKFSSPSFLASIVAAAAFLAACMGLFVDRPVHIDVALVSYSVSCLLIGRLAGSSPPLHAHRMLMTATLLHCVPIIVCGASVVALCMLVPAALHVPSFERDTRYIVAYALGIGLVWLATVVRYEVGFDLPEVAPELLDGDAFVNLSLVGLFTGLIIQRLRRNNHRAFTRATARARSAEDNLAEALSGQRSLERQRREIMQVRTGIEQSLRNERLARARLGASRQQLDQFAYAASHDLKEPVRTIASFLQMTRRRLDAEVIDRAGLRDHFAFVESGAKQMHTLLERLLLYSRAGRTAPKLTAVPVEAAWLKALAMRGSSHAATALRDASHACHASKRVSVDETHLATVLNELLDNATKFVGEGVTPAYAFEVVDQVGGYLKCRLVDNGIGIEPAYREQVFGLFKRLHPRESYPGGGVGLALVRRLCRSMDARISLSSIPGTGTTVHLSLRLA